MMTISYANNNNNNCLARMNKMEEELGDIYSAPEIIQNSDIIPMAKLITLKNMNNNEVNNVNECSSTDCSSNSDEDCDELQCIIAECSSQSFLKQIPESNLSLQVSEPIFFNNSGLKKYKCIKPSLFNPERNSILAKQNNSSDNIELPSLEKRISYLFEKVDENYYKIALMNSALKFNYPEELLLHLQQKSNSYNFKKNTVSSVFEDDYADYHADAEEDDINGLSEEELLQDLYSAPEVL